MKRLLSLILSLCLLVALLPAAPNADAADVPYGTFTINGVTFNYLDSPVKTNCWAYCSYYYQKVWKGASFGSGFSSSDNMLRNLPDSALTVTAEHIRTYINAAPLGSAIRVCTKDYLHGGDSRGHSQFLVAKSNTGFTVIEGGLWRTLPCAVTVYTWDYFVTDMLRSNLPYIKYIKYPNAVALDPNLPRNLTITTGNNVVGVNQDVHINVSAERADRLEVIVKDYGDNVVSSHVVQPGNVTLSFDRIGTFHVYLRATNGSGSVISEDCPFYVYCNHTFGDFTTVREPSCGIGGMEIADCTACGYRVRQTTPALGHVVGEPICQEATCIAEGEIRFPCQRCGMIVESDQLPAKGHIFETITVPATCEELGYDWNVCTVCGEQNIDNYTALADHQWNNNGSCDVCGKSMPLQDQPTEHQHQFQPVTVAPTCDAAGYEGQLCECGEFQLVTMLPAVHHFELTEQTAPSLAQSGLATYACSKCGLQYSEPIPALGAYANPFKDVENGRYYTEAVQWATSYGITAGRTATRFDPNAGATRAQFVTFLWRAYGKPQPRLTTNPFKDVQEGSYYYDAVLWAYENGITSGVSYGQFAPNAAVTRGQVVTFLWRGEHNPNAEDNMGYFRDVAAGSYCFEAVTWAAENSITKGVSANSFAPSQPCTRGQVVTFLMRTVG